MRGRTSHLSSKKLWKFRVFRSVRRRQKVDKTKWRTKIDIFCFPLSKQLNNFIFTFFSQTEDEIDFQKYYHSETFATTISLVNIPRQLFSSPSLMSFFSCMGIFFLSSLSIPIQMLLWMVEGARRTRKYSNKTSKWFNGHVTGWDETTSIESDGILWMFECNKKILLDEKLFLLLTIISCCLFIVFQWNNEKLFVYFSFFHVSHHFSLQELCLSFLVFLFNVQEILLYIFILFFLYQFILRISDH